MTASVIDCQEHCLRSSPRCLEWYRYCDSRYKDGRDRRACYDACWLACMELCQDLEAS